MSQTCSTTSLTGSTAINREVVLLLKTKVGTHSLSATVRALAWSRPIRGLRGRRRIRSILPFRNDKITIYALSFTTSTNSGCGTWRHFFHAAALYSLSIPFRRMLTALMHTYRRATHRIFLEVLVHVRESMVHDAVVCLVGPERKGMRRR